MYLGAMVMFFSHIFLSQSWIVAIGTIVVHCLLLPNYSVRWSAKYWEVWRWLQTLYARSAENEFRGWSHPATATRKRSL